MYLLADFLHWPYSDSDGSGCDDVLISRAHEIWRHSKERLEGDPSELDRIDAISSLRRAVNHRLKALTTSYGLDSLPSLRPKKQTLEKFQDYGLIRPALIKDLLAIRNLIEHEDAEPPDLDRCRYFIDIVWYFLKSTDSLLRIRIDSLIYQSEDGQSEIFLRIQPENRWEVLIKGKVRNDLLSEEGGDGKLKLREFNAKRVRGNAQFSTFSAFLIIEGDWLLHLARDYFGMAGYWYEDHV